MRQWTLEVRQGRQLGSGVRQSVRQCVVDVRKFSSEAVGQCPDGH